MKTCQECGTEIDGQALRCSSCCWAMRPLLGWAYGMVRQAIKRGELPELKDTHVPCVDCGTRAQVWEHRDYLRPVEVEPVCRICNRRRGPAAPCLARAPAHLAPACARHRQWFLDVQASIFPHSEDAA